MSERHGIFFRTDGRSSNFRTADPTDVPAARAGHLLDVSLVVGGAGAADVVVGDVIDSWLAHILEMRMKIL